MPHAIEISDKESAVIPHLTDTTLESNGDFAGHEIEQADDLKILSNDVQSQLVYLSPGLEFTKTNPPIQVVARESTARDQRTTVRLAQGPPETIRDVRGREHEFTLEQNGFKYVRNRSKFQDWESRDGIWTEYIEELKELVAREFGGSEGGVDEVIAFHEGVSFSNCIIEAGH